MRNPQRRGTEIFFLASVVCTLSEESKATGREQFRQQFRGLAASALSVPGVGGVPLALPTYKYTWRTILIHKPGPEWPLCAA
jgi:hypothetical protein